MNEKSRQDRWAILAGTRFALAMGVLGGHSFVYIRGFSSDNLLYRLGGVPAVMGFFLISGFSIAHSVVQHPIGFAQRRINRLAPLYYAGFSFAFIPVLLYGPVFSQRGGGLLVLDELPAFLAALVGLQGVLAVTPQLLSPYWSLSCEILYYCIAPSLRMVSLRVILLLITFSMFCYLIALATGQDSFNILSGGKSVVCLAWGWLLGYGIYRFPHSRILKAVMLLSGVILFTSPVVLAVVIILIYGLQWEVLPKLSRVLIYLGELSYPLYLTHYTVCLLVGKKLPQLDVWYALPLCWMCALVIATLFYHLIDLPMRKRARLQMALQQ